MSECDERRADLIARARRFLERHATDPYGDDMDPEEVRGLMRRFIGEVEHLEARVRYWETSGGPRP